LADVALGGDPIGGSAFDPVPDCVSKLWLAHSLALLGKELLEMNDHVVHKLLGLHLGKHRHLSFANREHDVSCPAWPKP
jgi:hypothetical protein